MSQAIMVPKSRAETPVGGGDAPFPEGNWRGMIEEVRVRPFPEWIDPETRPNAGYASSDGEILSIQLGSNAGLDEGAPDVGARKFFVDFVTRDGKTSIEAGPTIPDASWQMQRSAALLTNFALALGATEDVEYEGETYVATSAGFLDDLRSGALNGQSVGYSVYHKPWKNKAGKTGVEVRTKEFFALV